MIVMSVRLVSFRAAKTPQEKKTALHTHYFWNIKLESYFKPTYFACIFYLILRVAGVALTGMTEQTSRLSVTEDIRNIFQKRDLDCPANIAEYFLHFHL